jgi:hypothetical protein
VRGEGRPDKISFLLILITHFFQVFFYFHPKPVIANRLNQIALLIGDADSDGDGLKDSEDGDDDNDGLLDVEDADDDGDGISDGDEDHDGDGISNESKSRFVLLFAHFPSRGH